MEQSKYRPSKKLLDHVAKLIKGKPEYVLLDEQLVVYDKVMRAAEEAVKSKRKIAIIIRGGPRTGKSMLVQRFEILKDTGQTIASNAQRIQVHANTYTKMKTGLQFRIKRIIYAVVYRENVTTALLRVFSRPR